MPAAAGAWWRDRYERAGVWGWPCGPGEGFDAASRALLRARAGALRRDAFIAAILAIRCGRSLGWAKATVGFVAAEISTGAAPSSPTWRPPAHADDEHTFFPVGGDY